MPLATNSFFPQFIAFEDDVIQLGYDFKRDPSQAGGHIITGYFKNKSGNALSQVNMQVAAQKYMTLKMKPATGTNLAPFAQDITQEMVIVNNMEG